MTIRNLNEMYKKVNELDHAITDLLDSICEIGKKNPVVGAFFKEEFDNLEKMLQICPKLIKDIEMSQRTEKQVPCTIPNLTVVKGGK
jgi:hypothetical protein